MNTRNIYFVRHGETDANVNGTAQTSESQLTENGRMQAESVASYFRDHDIDHLITSEHIRAIDTGLVVNKHHNLELEKTDMLNERLKPASVLGLSHTDAKYQDFLESFMLMADDKEYRYEDGENFYDLIVRIKKILDYIETETTGNVIVVTHGILLRILVTYILTKSENMQTYVEGFKNIQIDNTGITHVRLQNGHWKFGIINDVSHLSEMYNLHI